MGISIPHTPRMSVATPKRFRAVLFDLDGTLLDTLEDIANSTNRVLARHGFPSHPIDAYRYFVGDGVVTLFTRALPAERRDEATIETCVRDYHTDYKGNWNVRTCLYPQVEELLDALTARGIPFAVLSNKPHEFTTACVECLLARWQFAAVCGQKANVPSKPDPAAALQIARELEIPPADFLYVGDTSTDILTASAAGMFPVGVAWGFRPRAELEQAGAKLVIEHPKELLGLL